MTPLSPRDLNQRPLSVKNASQHLKQRPYHLNGTPHAKNAVYGAPLNAKRAKRPMSIKIVPLDKKKTAPLKIAPPYINMTHLSSKLAPLMSKMAHLSTIYGAPQRKES